MKPTLISLAALVCFSVLVEAQKTVPAAVPAASKETAVDRSAPPLAAPASRKVEFAQMPLSFEPNVGQTDSAARFTAKSRGYTLQLGATSARLQFAAPKAGAESKTITMEMVGGNRTPEVRGEDQLVGKNNYFPTSDPKTWFSNIPTYSRVKYGAVYPGVDVAFYGNANRLEYDFMLQPKADPGQIRMKLSGANEASIDKDGSLVLRVDQDDVRFLVPVAYQTSADGKGREAVTASYRLEKASNGEPAMVALALGRYDRARPLVIDPVVVPALTYTQYLNGYVADVVVDASGDTYVAGQNVNGLGFYVTEYNAAGTVLYNTTVGTGTIYPYRVRVDSTGNAYAAGYINSGATLPTGSNSYKSTVTAGYNGFLIQIAAGGASVPYATFIGGTDTSTSAALGLAVQTISGVTSAFVTGWTYSGTFPVTAGVYQNALSGTPGSNYNGWVARFNPAASGTASLLYSTYLGTANNQFFALAADTSGNAYVTGNATSSTFPVTSGAFQYTGYYSGSGGVYVTKLNPKGTALVYSAYLGYGSGYGIAVDSSPHAYVTGSVGYEDFPTTAGAYQTSYPGGFAAELNTAGTAEDYSTFLGGPSSIAENGDVVPHSIALENGCTADCNAYISGWTSTTDFPAVDAIQTVASTSGNSAFVVELGPTGSSALFSSYLSGVTGYVWNGSLQSNSYAVTPAVGVDSTGNIAVVGNLGGTADFPVTNTNTNPGDAFLARIGSSSAPFTWSTPTSINFGNQAVGVNTSVYPGPQTVSIRNLSDTPVTISSIVSAPATLFSAVFSATDSCGTTIPAGGLCTLSLNFQPTVAGTRVGTITVNSNASDSPTVISVTGNGVDTDFTEASATSLSFSPQNVGTISAPQLVTLTNVGDETASLSIYVPYLGTDFTAVDTCSTPLAPGGTCVAQVNFAPTQTGLRTGTLYVQGGGGPTISIPLTGTGLGAGATGTLSFNAASLDFGSLTVGSTTTYQGLSVVNNSNVPITLSSITASGDFAIYSTNCGTLPIQLSVQSSCTVYSTFTPSTTGLRTGNLTFSDSATGSPQSVALSGTGLAAAQTLEFYPSAGANFGDDVPVGIQSGNITVYAQNAGTGAITMDRAVVSGDFVLYNTSCPDTTLAGTTEDGTGTLSYCYVNVAFKPTAAGLRTGTLTFIDSAGNSPQTVALSGNAIADSGTVSVNPTQLDFKTQAVGTTSAVQFVTIINPGNDSITVDSYKTGTGNFSVTDNNCPALPFTLTAGNSCLVAVQFTPAAAGSLTDSLTVTGSVGTRTVSLSGTGVAESMTIGFTPASPMNSGSVVVGQSSGANGSSDGVARDLVSIRNAGTAAVTFSASPAIGGTNEADFTLYNPNGCGNDATVLQPGASCPMWITFKPSVAAAETATLTFTDTATGTTQVLTLKGTGIAAAAKTYLSNNLLNFDNQAVGTTSPSNTYIRFYNNSGATVTLGNAVITAGFLVPGGNQTCNGATVDNGGSCYSYVSFAPTSAGLLTGTITFKNSGGTALASAPLTGYSPTPAFTGLLSPSTLNFTASQVVTTTSPNLTTVFTNTGNAPLTIGAITGTNLGTPPVDEFALASNGCSPQTLNPGGTCTIYVDFTPNAAGARTGSLTIPVTYTGGTTGSFTTNFTGTGTAELDSAVLQPGNGNFVDQTVGVQSPYTVVLHLVNQGNLPFKVNTVVGVNTIVGVSAPGEFSAESAQGGSDGCSGQTLPANAGSCQMSVTFTPSAPGTRTGSMGFPVTFADGTTKTITATLTGNGVAAAATLQFQPDSLEFQPEIINNTSGQAYIAVKNIGNKTVHFSAIASPSAGFILGTNQDGCYALSLNNLAVGGTCYIYVSFAPTAAGNITGNLTISDNATGGPHKLALSGTAILASQQIAISQAALTFASQPQGSTSSPQVVYVTNQSDSTVTSISAVLGGANPTDYLLTNGCGSSLVARAVCSLTIKFNPAATSTGTRTATVLLSDSDTGSPRTITMTGKAIVPGPAVALAPPSPLTFATQNVGTTSGTENFSVTNAGTENLTVTAVALGGTHPADFAIVSDGCSGASLTPNQYCVVGVRFSPKLGGTRTATASVTDNATGSPQTIGISGKGYGIPAATLSASSLTYANTYIGSTTAAQTVTLSNPGTDTLKIASIALTGPNTGDFTPLVNTCGTTLAPGGTCTISTAFAPTAVGSRTAAITLTDNANNVSGSTETVILNGTGLGVPTATLSATGLTFPSTYFATTSATAKTLTATNTGTAALNVTAVSITGADPGDFAQTNNCGDIAPSGVCTISVKFTPGAVGTRTATLGIVDNSGNVVGTTQTATLTGTGAADVSVSATTLAFGTITHATTKTLNLTVSNVGTIPSLTISTAISGTNLAEFTVLTTGNTCTAGVAPGKTCTLPVEFEPAAAASYAATLTITTNGGANPTVSLTGTGD